MPPHRFPDELFQLEKAFSRLYFKPTPETVVSDQIIVIPKFFSDDLCHALIKSFAGLRLETTPLVKSKDYAARVNDRVSVTDFATAASLWRYMQQVLQQEDYGDDELAAIRHIFESARALNPQLRIYRYRKGHHFGKHYDESVDCPIEDKPRAKKGTTKWTLLIYLTGGDEFAGGGTIFHPDTRGSKPLNIHPTKGMALLHKHGDDCLMHEGEMVLLGEKWVLRSDVVF